MAATLSAGEALARRKVSFLLRKGDTDLHASVEQKRCNRRVCDRATGATLWRADSAITKRG